MTTLKDVAALAGLSVSTVSYVLNGKKKVKDETYQRIMQAVEQSGYVPNQQARSLKTRSTLSVGVVVPDISNQFFPEIVKGIDDTMSSQDYSIILCNTDNNMQREEKCVQTLLGKDIDGIIYIGTAQSNVIQQKKPNMPVVLVDRKMGDDYLSVTSDNRLGGRLATAHLIEKGCRSIALFTGPVFITSFFDRLHGYMDALNAAKLPYREEMVFECDFSPKAGYRAARQMLERGVRADGIFVANDLMALDVMRALLESGVKLPGDMALVGYDDIYLASVVMPALTTVHQPMYEMGQKAAGMMLDAIRGQAIEPRQMVLQPTLVQRETT